MRISVPEPGSLFLLSTALISMAWAAAAGTGI